MKYILSQLWDDLVIAALAAGVVVFGLSIVLLMGGAVYEIQNGTWVDLLIPVSAALLVFAVRWYEMYSFMPLIASAASVMVWCGVRITSDSVAFALMAGLVLLQVAIYLWAERIKSRRDTAGRPEFGQARLHF